MNSHQTGTEVPYGGAKALLNKVPEITLYFWVIKVLCTTVGETAADFLNINLSFGLIGTSIATGILLAIALFFQFKSPKYVPSIYWSAVVLISVFGTLVTDILTDEIGIALEVSTIFFSLLLAGTFWLWFAKEQTLSIHSIFTRQREVFYWLAILVTFALGTASGDLMAEELGFGYLFTGVIVAVTVAGIAFAWRAGLNSILAFWLIYILTRPLGASIGDYLSQPTAHGGLNLGATVTSVIFLLAILGTVVFLTVTKRDVIKNKTASVEEVGSFKQTAIAVGLILVVSVVGYQWQSARLANEAVLSNTADVSATANNSAPGAALNPLGDTTVFSTITQDTLDLVNQNKLSEATTRIADLEYEWDVAAASLKKKDKARWTEVDDAIDESLSQLRARNVDVTSSKDALEQLLKTLK